VLLKLFAFELPEIIKSQAIFTFAAVWITMILLQNASLKRENRLACKVSRQLKRKQLHVHTLVICVVLHRVAHVCGDANAYA
jgi:hypothetical protein